MTEEVLDRLSKLRSILRGDPGDEPVKKKATATIIHQSKEKQQKKQIKQKSKTTKK